jgi:hypothetical protein
VNRLSCRPGGRHADPPSHPSRSGPCRVDPRRSLFEDPDYDLGYSRLVDLRRTDSSARSGEALRSIAAYVQRQYKDRDVAPKTAVVAPRDVSFGLARMYQAYSDLVPGEVVVFRAADAALAWLGIADERIPEVQQAEDREED